MTGYAGGSDRRLFKTTNGGLAGGRKIFSQFGIPTGFGGLYAYNDYIVWAVGPTGFILYTENGGLTESETISNSIPEDYTLYQNYP